MQRNHVFVSLILHALYKANFLKRYNKCRREYDCDHVLSVESRTKTISNGSI